MPAPSSDQATVSAPRASEPIRIFLTVGTQGPFDRLVQMVDAWAGAQADVEVFAQIGPSQLEPLHCRWTRDLEPSEFAARFEAATHIIAHAGCGTILSALDRGKPIAIMPRRAELGEHRNDHQVATAERFEQIGCVRVALEEQGLLAALDELVDSGDPHAWCADNPDTQTSKVSLIETIRTFIE